MIIGARVIFYYLSIFMTVLTGFITVFTANTTSAAVLCNGPLAYIAPVPTSRSVAQILRFSDVRAWQRRDLPSNSLLQIPFARLTPPEMDSVLRSLQTISKTETGAGGRSIGLPPVVEDVSLTDMTKISAKPPALITGNPQASLIQAVYIENSQIYIGHISARGGGFYTPHVFWKVIHTLVKKELMDWIALNPSQTIN